VEARASDALRDGFVTDDGWSVELERFVTALGGVDLDDPDDFQVDSCTSYSETNYEWLIDFAAASTEKVALVYGLGDCLVEWRFRGPSADTVLGAGAREEDLARMTLDGSDAYAEQRSTSLVVVGRARRGDVEKRFAWEFRRSFEVGECTRSDGTEPSASLFELEGEGEASLLIEVRGEELFREIADDTAPLTFDAFALADRDEDGEITLGELLQVPALAQPPVDPELAEDDPIDAITTLRDVVYLRNLPRVTRVAGGGPCTTEVRGR
jgi:hypothetical protein